MSEMWNFRHRHLQIGRMLDSDLIPDLRSKGVKCRTFLKNRNQRSSIFAQVVDPAVLPSTIDRWEGGHIKPHLEVIICIFDPWIETLRR
jgi:hypothetical protein